MAKVMAGSSADRPNNVRKKDRQRSKITNGTSLLVGVDGRSPWVRRCKDLIAAHLSDLGGADNTSAAERSIIRRASVMTVELEHLEAKFARAGSATADALDTYARVAGNLRRLLESVGLKRVAKTVMSPLAQRYAEQQLAEAAHRASDDVIEAVTSP